MRTDLLKNFRADRVVRQRLGEEITFNVLTKDISVGGSLVGIVLLDGIYDRFARKNIGWHSGTFFVDNIKVVHAHSFLKPIEGLMVDRFLYDHGFMVRIQNEFSTPQVDIEIVYCPCGSIELSEVGGVIFLMIF